jgi:nicotinamide-nucleotide amidase
MGAEILTIGTEILLGQIVDTNAAYIAERLAEAGIDLFTKTTVGDNRGRIAAALRTALERAEIVIATGGLGPTEDDLTREVFAGALGMPLRLDEGILAGIRQRFAARGIPMPENNAKQAMVPEGASVIPNPRGTAPGLLLRTPRGQSIACLPGVPSEMKPMLTGEIIPRLRALHGTRGMIRSRLLKVWGLAESRVDELINDLFRTQRNPSIALLAKSGEIHIRLTAKGEEGGTVDGLLDALEAKIRERIGEPIFGRDADELETVVGRLLGERRLTLAVAESCTGGLVAHRLTNVPGSSAYFERGLVTYSNRAKTEVLGVPEDLLAAKGAVSMEVTEAMAAGVRRLARTDLGAAVTGIAGPSGGTPEKPVGLTYIALAWDGGVVSRELRLFTERDLNRIRASQAVLDLVRRHLLGGTRPAS